MPVLRTLRYLMFGGYKHGAPWRGFSAGRSSGLARFSAARNICWMQRARKTVCRIKTACFEQIVRGIFWTFSAWGFPNGLGALAAGRGSPPWRDRRRALPFLGFSKAILKIRRLVWKGLDYFTGNNHEPTIVNEEACWQCRKWDVYESKAGIGLKSRCPAGPNA